MHDVGAHEDAFDHRGTRVITIRGPGPYPFLVAGSQRSPPMDAKALSAREREVVARAARGDSNKLIGYDLGLSPGSVASYLRRATQKMGASTRVELTRRFHEERAARAG
jgi:DNA-binding CsgD family transcriptional regulator